MIQDIFDPELYLALFEAKDPATNRTVRTIVCKMSYIAWENYCIAA